MTDNVNKALEETSKAAEEISKTVKEELPKIADNVSKMTDNVNEGIEESRESVRGVGKIVNHGKDIMVVSSGVGMLLVGLGIGYGLSNLGVECNPQCGNFNAEMVRYASMLLSTTGIAITILASSKMVHSFYNSKEKC